MRVLYVQSYTESTSALPSKSSDAIGYGITSSSALLAALTDHGHEIVCFPHPPNGATPPPRSPTQRAQLIQFRTDQFLDTAQRFRPDVVMIFHSFSTSAAIVRKALLDADIHTPIVGYIHGSHWDPTDTFRQSNYPGLDYLDLANMLALDRVLIVSESFRRHLTEQLSRRLPKAVFGQLQQRFRVVGFPIAANRIDGVRERYAADGFLNIIFNHAPIASKRPDIFIRVVGLIMQQRPISVSFTRRYEPERYPSLYHLAARYPGRVMLGSDLSIDDYYRALWRADLQVSTATHESLGVATLEAMYAETPCLLPDLPAYRELAGNDQHSLYAADGIDKTLYNALLWTLDADHLLESRALAARQRATSFVPKVIAGRVAQVLHEITAPDELSTP